MGGEKKIRRTKKGKKKGGSGTLKAVGSGVVAPSKTGSWLTKGKKKRVEGLNSMAGEKQKKSQKGGRGSRGLARQKWEKQSPLRKCKRLGRKKKLKKKQTAKNSTSRGKT